MTNVYKRAFTQVYVILNYLDEESYNKIPKNIICAINENMDKEYDFFIDESVSFYEQNLLEETKAILFNLYRDYLSDKEVREKILKYQRKEQILLEKRKQEKYKSNNIFCKN